MSKAIFRRVDEAVKRPKMLANLAQSFNISLDFLARMKNLTEEMQIFTEVEISTLETLINETQVCSYCGREAMGNRFKGQYEVGALMLTLSPAVIQLLPCRPSHSI